MRFLDDSDIASGHSNRYYALGTTQILLDYFSAQAREEAYAAIRAAFKNATIIKIFDQTVVQTEYLHAVNEALISPEEETASGSNGELTVVVAIATGIVAFLIAALLCFALMHERKKTKAHYNRNHGFDSFESISSKSRSQKSKQMSSNRSFSRLTNDFSSEYSAAEERYRDPQNYLPSTIWSVSDITSDDSGSIRSLLSRTTTKLESIEEGEEDEDMMEINHRRRKRRTMKEHDCFQFKKGSVYISNLAQCQNSLAMPKAEDLEVGMAKDLPVLLGRKISDKQFCRKQEVANAVSEVPVSSPSRVGVPTSGLNSSFVEIDDLQMTTDGCKDSNDTADIPTGSTISGNGEARQEKCQECNSFEIVATKSEPVDDGREPENFSPKVAEGDNSTDERDTGFSFVCGDGVTRESAQTNSLIDSAHTNHDAITDPQDKDPPREGDLRIDTSVLVGPEASATPVTSNACDSECLIDTESPSIVTKTHSEVQKKTKTPATDVEPIEAYRVQESSLYRDESDNEMDRGNTSLYSLDMDETIITFIDDIISSIDDSKLLETTSEQSKILGSNEATLDEIQTKMSDDSFFVDDQSASDIEDSDRECAMNITSTSIPQPKRRFVLTDITNSVLLDELKKKRVPFDEASDANTTYTL